MKVIFGGGQTFLESSAYYYDTSKSVLRIDVAGNALQAILALCNDKEALNSIAVYGDDINPTAVYQGYTSMKSLTIETDGDLTTSLLLKAESLEEKLTSMESSISDIERATGLKVDIDAMTLDEYKQYRQDENNVALAAFLDGQTVSYGGGQYGVTLEDQQEMALNYMQYQLLSSSGQSAVLEWHEKAKPCTEISLEDFLGITASVKSFVYPYYQYNQQIKAKIYECTSKDEAANIVFSYGNS